MERYDGRDLGRTPHITLLGSNKVGNFVVSMPLMYAIRKKYPESKLDYWGSDVTQDFEEELTKTEYMNAKSLIDWRISWDMNKNEKFLELSKMSALRGKPDLLINLDGFNPYTQVLASLIQPTYVVGPAMTVRGRNQIDTGNLREHRLLEEPGWNTVDFLDQYRDILNSQYIGELMCRMAFLDFPSEHNYDLPTKKPSFKVPRVLLHCTSTRKAKIWGKQNWIDVVQYCQSKNISVGLVGTVPSSVNSKYEGHLLEEELLKAFKPALGYTPWVLQDLRGQTSLIELAGACKQAEVLITSDSGPMHIGVAVTTKTLAIVGNDVEGEGASPIRLWFPQSEHLSRTVSTQTCTMCSENRFKNSDCIADEHVCMNGVKAIRVIEWIKKVIQ